MADYSKYKEERKQKSIQLIEDFANLVNGGADSEALQDKFKREHRTLQQSMFREILKLICVVSKLDDVRDIDDRNKASKVMAKRLVEGYAEIRKQEEIGYLKRSGFSQEEAEAKAEQYRKQILEDPEAYFGLRCI